MAFAIHFPSSNSRPAYSVRYPSWPSPIATHLDASPLVAVPAAPPPLRPSRKAGHPPRGAERSIYGTRQERTKISPTSKLSAREISQHMIARIAEQTNDPELARQAGAEHLMRENSPTHNVPAADLNEASLQVALEQLRRESAAPFVIRPTQASWSQQLDTTRFDTVGCGSRKLSEAAIADDHK